MAYDEKLADRIRETLQDLPHVEEKRMFRGLAFMVNGKMCINVSGDEMMLRFDPALHPSLVEKQGFRTMVMKAKELKGYGYVAAEGFRTQADFDFWIHLALAFNGQAKASKKDRNNRNS